MTTDITELTQREKFEAWVEEADALPWGILKKHRNQDGSYPGPHYTYMWKAWQAASAELVEALEKAKQHIARQEQILLNQDESLSIRRGELEAAQQERENWHTSFDNERFRADKLAATLSNEIEQSANVRGQLLIAHKTLLNQQAKIAELESRNVKLPERYACELGYNAPDPNGDILDRDAVIDALTAAGIKWEAE